MTRILESQHHLHSIVTRESILPPPGSPDDPGWRKSWDYLCHLYTPAMVRYVERVLSRHAAWPVDRNEAADVVQDYLAKALEKGWLSRDAEEIRCFRAYLQTQLQRFALSHVRKQSARRRRTEGQEGTGVLASMVAHDADPTEALDAAWVETILDRVLNRLREANCTYHAVIVDLLHTDGKGSRDLPERIGRAPSRAKDLRYRARRRFALLFFEQVRLSVRDEEAYESLLARLRPYLP